MAFDQKVEAVEDKTPHQKFKEEMARYITFLGKEDLEDLIRLCVETYFSRTKKVEVSDAELQNSVQQD